MNSLTVKTLALTLLLPLFVKAEVATSTDKSSYMMCKLQNTVRTIRVQKGDSGVCTTTYTKDGIDSVVSKSSVEDRCFQVLGNIKTNLEKANWKCKDISQTRVSSSAD